MNRSLTVVMVFFALAIGFSLNPKPASAQDQDQNQTYYTYASVWSVPRAQWTAFERQERTRDPDLRRLVADGTLVDWGSATVRVHQEDGMTHVDWMTASTRAALLKALEVQWTTAVNPSYVGATKHVDIFLHTLAHGGKSGSNTGGYFRVASYQAKPEFSNVFSEVMVKNTKSMLDAAVANGTLVMYNLDEEEIHTGAPGTFNIAMLFPTGEAMDRFYSNLETFMKQNPSLQTSLGGMALPAEHRDSLSRVTGYQHR